MTGGVGTISSFRNKKKIIHCICSVNIFCCLELGWVLHTFHVFQWSQSDGVLLWFLINCHWDSQGKKLHFQYCTDTGILYSVIYHCHILCPLELSPMSQSTKWQTLLLKNQHCVNLELFIFHNTALDHVRSPYFMMSILCTLWCLVPMLCDVMYPYYYVSVHPTLSCLSTLLCLVFVPYYVSVVYNVSSLYFMIFCLHTLWCYVSLLYKGSVIPYNVLSLYFVTCISCLCTSLWFLLFRIPCLCTL